MGEITYKILKPRFYSIPEQLFTTLTRLSMRQSHLKPQNEKGFFRMLVRISISWANSAGCSFWLVLIYHVFLEIYFEK